MQSSWRQDGDKLTFIVCKPLEQSLAAAPAIDGSTSPSPTLRAGEVDAPERMLGDVNLFLTRDEDNAEVIVGEVEIMVARKESQGKGYGEAALRAFLGYVGAEERGILGEYTGSEGREVDGGGGESGVDVLDLTPRVGYLRAKIGKDNARSIRLFEKVGFCMWSPEPNYFGEVELRLEGLRMEEWMGATGRAHHSVSGVVQCCYSASSKDTPDD